MAAPVNIWTAPLGNNPLVRAVRHHTLTVQLEDQLHEIARDTETTPIVNSKATAPGDSRKLRGIPALAKGVASTCPGTDPLRAVLAKERRTEERNPA